jgi:hypothetical protein
MGWPLTHMTLSAYVFYHRKQGAISNRFVGDGEPAVVTWAVCQQVSDRKEKNNGFHLALVKASPEGRP